MSFKNIAKILSIKSELPAATFFDNQRLGTLRVNLNFLNRAIFSQIGAEGKRGR